MAGSGEAMAAGAIANAPRDGRFIGSSGLTDKQRAFVGHYVANGCEPVKAAGLAGYSCGATDGPRLMRNSAVLEAIRAETLRRIETEGPAVALGVLLEVATDKGQTGAARVSAAKALMSYGGHDKGAARQLAEKPLEERTLAELDAFIAGGMAQVQAIRSAQERTIEGELVAIAPRLAPDDGVNTPET